MVLLFHLLFASVAIIVGIAYLLRRRSEHDGITIAMFHPYCNAGGGGERVLFCAMHALLTYLPHAHLMLFTGDRIDDVSDADIIHNAYVRFNITLPSHRITIIRLCYRWCVEASCYPIFTLLGQSIGSTMLAMEALIRSWRLLPHVVIDTMGYAFTMPLFRFIGGCRVGAYVHYPTISTDMLTRVVERRITHNNDALVASSTTLSVFKLWYYHAFAMAYGIVGRTIEVIAVNSSWTQRHIIALWRQPQRTHLVFPPCDTSSFTALPLAPRSNTIIVSVAQFRPEKDHSLQIKAFSELLHSHEQHRSEGVRLRLIGSCRDDGDARRIDALRSLAKELCIEEHVDFVVNASFNALVNELGNATIGIHTMWNEHFGIGIVEYMAAGAIVVAHNSGGPKADIVVDNDDNEPTGYLADNVQSYADCLHRALTQTADVRIAMQRRARASVATRFGQDTFDKSFLSAVAPLFQ